MSGTDADSEVLQALGTKLRNASTDLESGASAPPDPQAGVVTDAINSTTAVLTEALGNLVSDVSALGDAVADSRNLYVETDYEQAAALQAQEMQAEQPR